MEKIRALFNGFAKVRSNLNRSEEANGVLLIRLDKPLLLKVREVFNC